MRRDKESVFLSERFDLIWRVVIGSALFCLMATAPLKAYAPGAPPQSEDNEAANTKQAQSSSPTNQTAASRETPAATPHGRPLKESH